MLYINTTGSKKKKNQHVIFLQWITKERLFYHSWYDDDDEDDDYEEGEGDGAAWISHVEQIGSDRLQKRSFKNTSGDISVSMFR